MIRKAISFISRDIWNFNLEDLPKNQSFLIRQLQIIVLAIRGFNEDKCGLRASALTMFSILSVVPILALAFGIAKGFSLEERLEVEIKSAFAANPDIVEFMLDFAHSALNNTQGGLVAGIGVVVLLWTVMRVLNNIETSFNEIWEIRKPRSIFRKFSDYLTIILVAPILIVIAGGLTGFASSNVIMLTEKINWLGFTKPYVEGSMGLIPYFIIWTVLTLLYMVMPNTKVRFIPALIAGVVVGTVFQLFEQSYIWFQVEVSTYNAIYGSFAALPLFILWMQISWLLVLFGAELSFAHQNVANYQFESGANEVNVIQQRVLALMMMRELVRNIQNEEEPISAGDFSRMFNSPIRLIRQILAKLEENHLVQEVAADNVREDDRYILATDFSELTIQDVLMKIEKSGPELPLKSTQLKKRTEEVLSELRGDIRQSQKNILVKDL